LPANDSRFVGATLADLQREMYEDLLLEKEEILDQLEDADIREYRQLEKRLNSINNVLGEKTNISEDELIDQWIYEMHGFTFAQGKMLSTAEHDDLAMACWLCEQAINSVGFDFSFGDEELAEISEEKDQLGINPKNKSELEPEELLQELLNQNKIKRPVPKNYDLAELVDESEYWSD